MSDGGETNQQYQEQYEQDYGDAAMMQQMAY